MDQLIPGADKDIVTPLAKRIGRQYEAIWLGTKVTAVERRARTGSPCPSTRRRSKDKREGPRDRGVRQGAGRRRPPPQRQASIGADAAGVFVDERGFIPVDKQQRTNVAHIFAIGDVVGQPMLAHKAMHEGKVAAENTAGQDQLLRRHRHPVGGLHRPRGGLGRGHRERGQGGRGEVRQGRVPVGRVRAGRCRWGGTRA